MVDGVLLAIGGAEDRRDSKKTSAIHAYHHVDLKWQHVGDLPFECSLVDTLLLSGGSLLVINGCKRRQVLKISVEG